MNIACQFFTVELFQNGVYMLPFFTFVYFISQNYEICFTPIARFAGITVNKNLEVKYMLIYEIYMPKFIC